MGHASNRKKAQRHAGQKPQDDAAAQRTRLTLAAGAPEKNDERDEGIVAASRVWCGGADPVPAQVRRWAEGSLGHRFFAAALLSRMRTAPCLSDRRDPGHYGDPCRFRSLERRRHPDPGGRLRRSRAIPPAGDQAAWDTGAHRPGRTGLQRGLRPRGVRTRTGLGPRPAGLPELDGPVFLLGTCALVEAFGAVVRDDSFGDVLGVLLPALEDAFPALDSHIVADALIGAFAAFHDCDQPDNAAVMARITSAAVTCWRTLPPPGLCRPNSSSRPDWPCSPCCPGSAAATPVRSCRGPPERSRFRIAWRPQASC